MAAYAGALNADENYEYQVILLFLRWPFNIDTTLFIINKEMFLSSKPDSAKVEDRSCCCVCANLSHANTWRTDISPCRLKMVSLLWLTRMARLLTPTSWTQSWCQSTGKHGCYASKNSQNKGKAKGERWNLILNSLFLTDYVFICKNVYIKLYLSKKKIIYKAAAIQLVNTYL